MRTYYVAILHLMDSIYLVWAISNHSRQSRGVKNLIKGGITIDCVNNTSVNNSNVALNVGQSFWVFNTLTLIKPV